MRVADYIAAHLERLGVRAVFCVSGGGMMHLLDAVSRRPGIRCVSNHHEQASAMAAEAYARTCGGLGVVYATSGPGGTNTITGLVGAWLDSAPVLCVTGQSKLEQTIRHSGLTGLRQYGTFEVDIVPMVRGITKYAAFLDDPRQVRYHLEKACALALSGRPGPVLLDVPVDVQGALIEPDQLPGYTELPFVDDPPPTRMVQSALQRLAGARRPLVLAGHGVRTAGMAEAFRRFVETLRVPVAVSCMAVDLMEYDVPLYVGRVGIKGDRAGNFAVQTADVILTLGCSLHVMTTGYELDRFAPQAFKIQVDLDEMVLRRERVGVQEKVRSSVQAFLAVAERCLRSEDLRFAGDAWVARCASWKHELAVAREPRASGGDEPDYYDFVDALSDALQGGETVVADAGSAFYVMGQAFRPKRGQRVIISGGLGTMGYSLPAASGACMASLGAPVVAVTGDGSLQSNIHELAVAREHRLDARYFVVNNQGYMSIRNTQRNFFGGHLVGTGPESGVRCPPLEAIAAAYGVPYRAVRARDELRRAVEETLAAPGPRICEIFTVSDHAIRPAVSSVRLESGAMESQPLHNMAPFMDEATLARYLTVPR